MSYLTHTPFFSLFFLNSYWINLARIHPDPNFKIRTCWARRRKTAGIFEEDWCKTNVSVVTRVVQHVKFRNLHIIINISLHLRRHRGSWAPSQPTHKPAGCRRKPEKSFASFTTCTLFIWISFCLPQPRTQYFHQVLWPCPHVHGCFNKYKAWSFIHTLTETELLEKSFQRVKIFMKLCFTVCVYPGNCREVVGRLFFLLLVPFVWHHLLCTMFVCAIFSPKATVDK